MQKPKYLKPATLGEALTLLEKYGQEAKIIAGGTDVMVWEPPLAEIFNPGRSRARAMRTARHLHQQLSELATEFLRLNAEATQ